MRKPEATKILRENISINGHNIQVSKTIEELGELVQAISKYTQICDAINKSKKPTQKQYDKRQKCIDFMYAEIADVEITLHTMRLLFGDTMIDEWKDFKLRRLRDRNDKKRKPR